MFVVFMMQSPKHRVAYRSLLKDTVYAAVTRPAKQGPVELDALRRSC
jgi:hypothetical protein